MAVYKSKISTKDGRQYFFRIKYKDIFGELHDYTSQKFKTLKEATSEEARYRIKIANSDICTTNITIDQVYQELSLAKSKTYKKQTIIKNGYLYGHLSSIKSKKINELNLADYKKLLTYIESLNFTSDYNNKILGLLKQIIIYSNKYYNTSKALLIYIEPFKNTNERKKEMLFFTYEEYLKFDAVIKDHDYHTFFEILYFNGLRQGEAQALTWNDIDFKKNEININKTLTTKIKDEKWTISSPKTTESNRILPMTKKVADDLKTMYKKAISYKDYSDNWFVFGNTEPFKETTIQKRKNNYCDNANLKRIRVHDFRHSCASLLINKGATIALVSKYLGHSNISITLNTYTHMFKNELDNVTNLLNRL